MVAHGHGRGGLVDGDGDLHRPALAVLEGVDDEVAQDALDPAGVDLGVAGPVRGDRDGAAPAVGDGLGRLHRPGDRGAQVDELGVEGRRTGVEPADLEQVGEQLLEPVELVVQQLGRAGDRGVEAGRESWMRSAAIRMVVSGVRSSCETSETNRCWTRDSPSSWRIWVCRLSAISLNDFASRARSSSPRARIRSLSRPEDSRSATTAARRTGLTT